MTDGDGHWASVAELASTRHGVFTRKQAHSVGLSNKRLTTAVRQRRVKQPLANVFVFASHVHTYHQRCAIACAAGAVVSHSSAAAIHRLDGFSKLRLDRIEVCFPRDNKRLLPRQYVVHTWRYTSRHDITTVDGIACTSIARTLIQLGLNQSRSVVELALDSALRNGTPAAWIEHTMNRLRRRGPTGLRVLESIVTDPGRSARLNDSALESIVESAIRDPDLPRPARQYEVLLETGVRRFDLAFPDAKLGIEGHSRQFHFGPAQTEIDNLRDFELAAAGWEVVYITWAMAHEPALFLRLLKQTYHRRKKMHML